MARGARLICTPECFLDGYVAADKKGRTNELFIAFAHPHVAFIVNPKGETVAKLQNNIPDVLVPSVDLAETRDEMFRHRRSDLYDL